MFQIRFVDAGHSNHLIIPTNHQINPLESSTSSEAAVSLDMFTRHAPPFNRPRAFEASTSYGSDITLISNPSRFSRINTTTGGETSSAVDFELCSPARLRRSPQSEIVYQCGDVIELNAKAIDSD